MGAMSVRSVESVESVGSVGSVFLWGGEIFLGNDSGIEDLFVI